MDESPSHHAYSIKDAAGIDLFAIEQNSSQIMVSADITLKETVTPAGSSHQGQSSATPQTPTTPGSKDEEIYTAMKSAPITK